MTLAIHGMYSSSPWQECINLHLSLYMFENISSKSVKPWCVFSGPNPLSVLRRRTGPKPDSKRQKISERRKWRKVRKTKSMPAPGTLEDLMLRELAVESLMGDRGVIYRRKRICELLREVTQVAKDCNGSWFVHVKEIVCVCVCVCVSTFYCVCSVCLWLCVWNQINKDVATV
jgi:hypothetical protein